MKPQKFRALLSLTDWNLRAVRRPILRLCVLMGPLEFAMTAISAMRNRQQAIPFLLAWLRCYAWLLLPMAMIAAAVLHVWQEVKNYNRPRSIYTLMTLPVPRSFLYFSRMLASLLSVGCVVVSQAVWLVVMYLPFTALSGSTLFLGQERQVSAFLQDGLWLNLNRSSVMHLVLPTTPLNFLCELVMVLALLAALETLATLRTWRGAALMGLTALVAGYHYIGALNGFLSSGPSGTAWEAVVAILEAGICLAAAVWAGVHALKKGENIPGGKQQ